MKTKLRVIGLLLTLVSMTLLAAQCVVPAEPQTVVETVVVKEVVEKEAAPMERAELTVWAVHTTGPETELAMRKLIEQFNKEHPDIHVSYEQVSGQMVYPKFLTAVRGAEMPDVADGYAFHPLQFAAMGQMMPLDHILAEWEENGLLDNLINEAAYKVFSWDGHYWAVPWEVDLRAIYYRKDLLEEAGIEPPTNWDEFRDAVIALNDPDNDIYGLSYPGGNFHITQHYYFMFMVQNGGSIIDEEGNLVFGTTSKDANVEALEYMTDFTLKHNVTPPGVASWNTDEAETIFVQGRSAFLLGRGGTVTRLMQEAPDMLDKVGVLETLQGPVAKRTTGFYAPFFIWTDTPNPEAAETFLTWLVQPGRIEPLYAARPGQMWPVWQSDFDLSIFKENPLMDEVNNKVVPYVAGFNYPASISVPQLGAIDGEKMFAIPVNEVLAGAKTPEQAVEDAHAAMAELWESE